MTKARIAQNFFWPCQQEDVEQWGSTCPDCQKTQDHKPLTAPLQPTPIIEIPFSQVALDIVGLLPKTSSGYQYILVHIDYATQFPETIPLPSITAPRVAEELLKWIA